MQSCSFSARATRLAITLVILTVGLADLPARANDRATVPP